MTSPSPPPRPDVEIWRQTPSRRGATSASQMTANLVANKEARCSGSAPFVISSLPPASCTIEPIAALHAVAVCNNHHIYRHMKKTHITGFIQLYDTKFYYILLCNILWLYTGVSTSDLYFYDYHIKMLSYTLPSDSKQRQNLFQLIRLGLRLGEYDFLDTFYTLTLLYSVSVASSFNPYRKPLENHSRTMSMMITLERNPQSTSNTSIMGQ